MRISADAYVKKIRAAYPGVPGRGDFCVYWFRKAHDHLQDGGCAGLVGTNSIRQIYSREGGLDYIVKNGGVITEAFSTHVWSGDAQMHVSIVNWEKSAASHDEMGSAGFQSVASGILPDGGEAAEAGAARGPARAIRQDAEPDGQDARAPLRLLTFQRGDCVDSPWETFELPAINPALAAGIGITGAQRLATTADSAGCFEGQLPGPDGLRMNAEDAAQ